MTHWINSNSCITNLLIILTLY